MKLSLLCTGLESFVPMSNDAEEEDTPPMSKKKRYFEENEPEGEGSGKKLTSKQVRES